MKRLILIALLFLPLGLSAQVIDTIDESGVGVWEDEEESPSKGATDWLPDTVYLYRTDTVVQTIYHTDSVYILHTDTVIKRVADTAALSALREKEKFYREILSANGVDKERLEAERNYYIHMVDSLRAIVRIAEIEAVRREEANKYLEERARAAEEKNAASVNKKKKVRPIQGIAMRFYRTPKWEVEPRRTSDGTYELYPTNNNGGNVEFDYVTGASVMLWDMTPYFNQNHAIGDKGHEIKRFDQEFSYDLGLYVGFGGSNLFKNFYTGVSFRFVDFFYLTTGVNIAEYQVLKDGYSENKPIGDTQLKFVLSDVWQIKPFVALNIDLDFLGYIKK